MRGDVLQRSNQINLWILALETQPWPTKVGDLSLECRLCTQMQLLEACKTGPNKSEGQLCATHARTQSRSLVQH